MREPAQSLTSATIWNRLAVAAAAAMLAACAAAPQKPEPAAPEPLKVPVEVADALLPGNAPVLGLAGPSLPEEPRFDVNVQSAPARGFFLSLVAGTPYNMVVQSGVIGEITVDLKNVTVPEVMQAVQEAFGYEYRTTPYGFVVLGNVLATRIFQINYLNLSRKGRSNTRVSSGQLTDALSSDQSGLGGNSGGNNDGANSDRSTVIASGIETTTSSDVWLELDRTLKLLVPPTEGRNIVINRDSGIIVARAMPSELRLIGSYLDGLQDSLGRQVILEAKILEVTLNDTYQAGINWAAIGDSQGRQFLGGIVGGNNVFNAGNTANAGSAIAIPPNYTPDPITGAIPTTPFTNTLGTAIGGAFIGAVNAGDFSAVIELLRAQGDVQVLSSPRVATINNQKAIIKVGSDEFFVTGISSDTTTGASTNTSQDVELTPFFSGISLDVTPQIDSDANVTLHVHPIVSDVQDQTKTILVQNQQQVLPLALSNVRETDSIVRARNGQVVVIGGLMQQTDGDESFGLPGLANIPVIGNLFKQKRKRQLKSELVILLRPIATSLKGSASWEPTDHLSPPPPAMKIP